VRHELGTTTVAAAPSRVVAATDGAELASLLALGVRPVGYGQRNDPQRPWIVANGGADLPSYRLAGSETSFERLAAWRPDLIVAQLGFADESTYPRYTAIAPTVATSFIDWRASLRTVADAVGRTADADRLLRQTDDATAAARARLTRYAGKRVRIFTAFATGEIYVMNDASPVGKVAADLGIAPFPAAKRPGEAVDLLPLERLGELDADLLLVQHFGPERDGYESLARRELYRRLPVVKAGRSVQLTADESFASYFDSVLTVPLNVALLERHLPAMDA
jgi:iron complex transport system substrate-binding protein